MEFLGQEMDELLQSVPESIRQLSHLPPEIPTYSLAQHPLVQEAGMQLHGGIATDVMTARVTQHPSGKTTACVPRKEKLSGLGIHYPPTVLSDAKSRKALQLTNGHEMFHAITRMGVSGWMRSVNEALTDPLVQARYGNTGIPGQSLADINAFHWDGKSIQSTTGFMPPDCANVSFSKQGFNALYISSPHALRGIAAEQVWKIWELLLEDGESTGCYPLVSDVRNAILSVLQETGERVLGNPCFQSVKAGNHVFSISAEDLSCSVAIPLQVSRNPAYGVDSKGTFNATVATVHPYAKQIPYTLIAQEKDGGVELSAGGRLGKIEPWSYTSLRELLNRSPLYPHAVETVPRMELRIPGLRPLVILESENDPGLRTIPAWEALFRKSRNAQP